MAILRHAPGERVPIAGTYALVGHYGDPMGYSAWFDEGDELPLAYATAPLWYVLVDVAEVGVKAA
jgi:hypothetical protein